MAIFTVTIPQVYAAEVDIEAPEGTSRDELIIMATQIEDDEGIENITQMHNLHPSFWHTVNQDGKAVN